MSISIKPGVRIQGMRPELNFALQIIDGAYKDAGHDCVITAVIDGTHMAGSLHYAGCAVDVRTRDLKPSELETLKTTLAGRLSGDFDVVLEGDHFHIEYQPKQPYGVAT